MKTSEQRMQEILRRASKQSAARARRNKRAVLLSVTAGFLALVLALNLLLFIPYPSGLPDLSRYADSEYYTLMQKLNELTYSAPEHKNNFDAWFGDFFDGLGNKHMSGTAGEDFAPAPDASESGYREVTDNQEAGVIEGDLFKRTGSHIFYLTADGGRNMSVGAYTIGKEDSALCGTLDIASEENTYFRGGRGSDGSAELYLSEDGDTLTVFTPVWSYEHSQLYTAAISVDVSDPANMKEAGRTYLSGSYVTSRKAGEDFLLISNFAVRTNPDFSDEAQFLPQAGPLDALESLPMEDIVLPENADAARYTVILRLEPDLSVSGHAAFLSFSEEAYVSQENIFVTRGYTAQGDVDGEEASYTFSEARTQISCVSYAGGGLELAGSADIAGEVLDQYSMDEQDGNLRVVTTVNTDILDLAGDSVSPSEGKSASLFVISLEDFEVVASLERFAPAGESVLSARFEENIAWVCTAIAYTPIYIVDDPVFRIDLTDLNNITYTDTGTIPGYSFSLVDFAGGTLLGIGYDDLRQPKIEIYEQAGAAVEPISSYVFEDCMISETYKAFYIDRENGLIGMHVLDMMNGSNTYVLLHFDGYKLEPLMEIPLVVAGEESSTRATVIDGWLYVITYGGIDFKAEPLPGLAG